MPRGGYQKPSKPAPVSGPGKLSRRTDGGPQPIREPDIDLPGLEYGDRSRLTEAQRIAKAAGGSPIVQPQGEKRVEGRPGAGTLPPWLFEADSARPGEPVSEGLPMGPGAGPEALIASEPAPDQRELVLEHLWQTYNNRDALEMLQQLRAERASRVEQAPVRGRPLGEALDMGGPPNANLERAPYNPDFDPSFGDEAGVESPELEASRDEASPEAAPEAPAETPPSNPEA